ncbi:unnamed protein product [Prunus brigantina]
MTFINLNSTELKLEASGTNEPAVSELDAAATMIQKFYRSYSTRRGLADCAVVADELWFKRKAALPWLARARTRARSLFCLQAQKGFSKDQKAQN